VTASSVRARNAVSAADFGLLVLRAAPGLLVALRGSRELLGWFGGNSFADDVKFYGSVGYSPAKLWAIVSGVTEIGGGLLLTLGLLTPLAAAAVMGVMLNAIVAYQIPAGFLASGGDLVAVVGLGAVGIACTGPGRLAMDRARSWLPARLTSPVFSLVLGLGLGAIVLIFRAGK
jgi:putative oxidoreductase